MDWRKIRPYVTLGVIFLLSSLLSACAVGPGTPLFDAMGSGQGRSDGTVQPPDGYGAPKSTVEADGLINTQQREETAAYLKSLAIDDESGQGVSIK